MLSGRDGQRTQATLPSVSLLPVKHLLQKYSFWGVLCVRLLQPANPVGKAGHAAARWCVHSASCSQGWGGGGVIPNKLWTAFLAEATSCSFVQRPQKPGGKQKYVSKDRNVASLEGIPCLIPATAHSDPGSVEGQPSGVPQLCSASWALSA